MDVLTRFGLEKSRFTIFFMISLLLLGLYSYFNLSKREDPAITIRTAVVVAKFPGMSPERLEHLVAEPLERAAREVSEVEDIKVLISTGSVVVYLDLYESLPSEAIEGVFQDIRNRMNGVKARLPVGTIGPFVNTDYGDVVIASISVTGDGYSYAEIEDSAKSLRKALYRVKGIGKVNLYGGQEERIWLDIDSRKLAVVGVQLPRLLRDLQAQNVILSAGDIDAYGNNIIIEANGDLESVDAIGNVLTRIEGTDSLVRLKDLVRVRRGYQEPRSNPVYFNGKPAIVLGVQMSDGQDIQVLGENLKNAVSQFEQTQPVGIVYDYSTYQETDVTTAINNALSNVIQTAIVVLLVLVVFLGIRPALIVACIVPFTVMFALIFMGYLNIELHVVSIAAVIISLGLLVDNGLVIVEDIQGRISRGQNALESAIDASKQFGTPLAIASITTVSAFIPLFLVEGTNGEYGFALGAVVALMLAGSWFVAIYILPVLCVWFSKSARSDSEGSEGNFLETFYGRFLKRSLSVSVLVVGVTYLVVMFAGVMFSGLKNEMFPLSARNQFLIYVDLPKGTSISETEREVLSINHWLSSSEENPEIRNTTAYVGDGGPRFYLALSPADTNPASAFILVNTFDYEGALRASERARRYLYKNHPAVRAKVKQLSMGGGESGIVEVKISGPDNEQLLSMAKQVEDEFSKISSVVQNENDWGNKVVRTIVDIAQDKAREHGVTSKDISQALRSFISGASVSEYREGDKSIPIMIRGLESYRDSLEDLEGITVPVNGNLVVLEQVASLTPVFELSQIRRENQQKTITISAKSSELSAFDLMEYIDPVLREMEMTGGYSYKFDGEIEESAEVNGALLAGVGPALLLMLAAVMFQFNSCRRVVLIFLTIPLVFIGSPLALSITGQPLSFFAMLGLISLAGIIINNAIVLIDQIDIEWKTVGLSEAIQVAARKRVTPILLTTLTTVVGLMPMAIAGGALFEPMAILMIGGLMFASLISLIFVPSAFYLLFKNEADKKGQLQGGELSQS